MAAIDLRSVNEPWAQSFFDGEDEAKQQALSALADHITRHPHAGRRRRGLGTPGTPCAPVFPPILQPF